MYEKSAGCAFLGRWFPASLSVLVLCQACSLPDALAYTPSNPEVTQMLDKAMVFLAAGSESRLGGKCAVATVFLKHGHDATHPKIKEAVEACRETAQKSFDEVAREDIVVYQIALALIFLTELDTKQYHSEIDTILGWLRRLQKEHGGWGYPSGKHAQTGDTSQTQYAVLSCWIAKQAKQNVPKEVFLGVLGWLVRTQDPSGCWGYQGIDSGSLDADRVPQDRDKNSLSLAAAGLGSVYMCADALNMTVTGRVEEESAEGPKLPAALKLVEENPNPTRGAVQAGPGLAKAAKIAMRDGNQWFEKNFSAATDRYQYYYLYALERYQSFRELAEQQSEAEPAWYNAGVKQLMDTQQENGAWPAECGGDGSVDTALACLFLKRSTKTTIDEGSLQFDGGRLSGGRGLPKKLNNVRIRKGKIVNVEDESSTTVEDVVGALNDPTNPDFQKLMENPEQFAWDSIPAGGRAVEALRRLVKEGAPDARRMAIIALGKRRDLDNLPAFIYGLSDPDSGVSVAARDALRFVSRRFDGFGMPDEPQTADKRDAAQAWTAWLVKIRPDAELWE